MLSAADNDLLTQVGPGTPMGEYMRQYWMPAVRSAAVPAGGDPVQARLLGQDLVIFRGTNGDLGCVDEKCPHRRASLALAKNDGDRITCLYHGWQFGTDGTCVHVPTEPADKRGEFAARVKVKRHPVAEAGGMVWVYLGDPDNPPPLPDFEFNHLPADHVRPFVAVSTCNWLQCLEGLVDTVHVGQLHQSHVVGGKSQLGNVAIESAPTISTEECEYGIRSAADRKRPDGDSFVRVTAYLAPFWSFIPHGPTEDRVSMGIIPVDDHTTLQWYVWYDHSAPLRDDTDLANYFEPLLRTPDDFSSSLRGKPKWGQDREALGRDHFTGIYNIVLEDVALQESQGVIMDRTQEHLGSSDAFVTKTRRLLLRSARKFQSDGTVFPDPRTISLRKVRALAVDMPAGQNWRSLGG